MFRNKYRYGIGIVLVAVLSYVIYIELTYKVWGDSIRDKTEIAQLKEYYGQIRPHYLAAGELREFKICPKELLTKARTMNISLTYSKEFDKESNWTIFKDLEAGNYRMYFDVSLEFKNKSRKDKYCFYNAGVFKDNMVLKNVPYGTISQIYFLKYDKKKKQYYGKILGRGLDGNGYFKENLIHELSVPPQTMPRTHSGQYRDVQFYLHAIPKK